jgi:hypothetical protein
MTTAPASSGNSKKLIIGLAIGGGVLLLAVVALLFLLLGRGLATPSAVASPSPSDASATPLPTPSETPGTEPVQEESDDPPADNSVRFTSFNAPTTTECDAGDEDNQPPKPRIQVSWAGANAVEAYYLPNPSEDISTGYPIPTSGNQEQILIGDEPSQFPCFHEEDHDYTIVLVGAGGTQVAKHWNVRNVGDQ